MRFSIRKPLSPNLAELSGKTIRFYVKALAGAKVGRPAGLLWRSVKIGVQLMLIQPTHKAARLISEEQQWKIMRGFGDEYWRI